MSKVTIFHNPRCSKSRQTLQLLHDHDIEAEVVLYLQSPPSPGKIQEILELLGLQPRDLMRRKEAAYKALGLADESLTAADLVRAMAENPVLIERPIVLANGKAAIGRPPENVLDIL